MFKNKNEPLQKRNKKIYYKNPELSHKCDPESDLALGDFMIFVPNGPGQKTAKDFLAFVKSLKIESVADACVA
ncbi:hypothetical protein K2X05_11565 [bacterium]|nr:hypothetical protein [bacterium]